MNSCGYMLGSLLIGALYDRVPKLKLLGLLTILNGVTSALLPWCSSFGLFLFVRLVDGTLCGGRDGGGNAKVSSCWGFAVRPYMQALHFTYAFGGIISPIVTSHFLAPRITLRNPTTNVSYGNGTNTSAFVQSSNRHGDYNNSMVDDERAEHSFT
ncbi:MFS4B-like protein, partial [Mya arenaria]